MFHDLGENTAETADRSFAYLAKKYNIIDLNKLIAAIEKKDFSDIPPKALVITFDDGHIRNYEMLPAIKKHNIPITIFLCASIINTNRHFWFSHISDSALRGKLKLIPTQERLNILSKTGYKQDKEFEDPEALQKEQIEEMIPFVNMQSHTLFHPILPMCEYDEAKHEIAQSKKKLEEDYNLNINAIAYPNGDYSMREVELIKATGYKCGITVDYGFNTIETDPFRLKRISAGDTEDINELVVKASGLWACMKTRNGRKQKQNYTTTIGSNK